LRLLQVNASQQQQEFLASVARAGSFFLRPSKSPSLKPASAQPISPLFPEEDLDPISSPITKNVQTAAERILAQTLPDQDGQPVVGFAQICGRRGQEDRGRGQQADHLNPSNTVSNRRKESVSNCRGIFRERPVAQLSTYSPPNTSPSIFTGTNRGSASVSGGTGTSAPLPCRHLQRRRLA
jgi:hypothetical protein